MIACKELNRDFDTKKQLLAALVAEKSELIKLKKATIKESLGTRLPLFGVAGKAIPADQLKIGDVISNVINTTMYFDHHRDVHLNGIWNKSAKEQNGKTYHVINHDLSLGNIVGYPKDVSIEVRLMAWRSLGLQIDGMTEALIFHTKVTDKMNEDAYKAYRDNEAVQHSIRMEYVDIMLGVDDPEMKDEYAYYQKILPQIANRSAVEEVGYFWGVAQAKISAEGSTVLFGSNDMTPPLGIEANTTGQPFKDDTDSQPPALSFQEVLSQFKNNIKL